MSSHLLLPGLCPVTDAEEETLIEREVLAHALRRSRLQLAALRSRSGAFWSRVAAQAWTRCARSSRGATTRC